MRASLDVSHWQGGAPVDHARPNGSRCPWTPLGVSGVWWVGEKRTRQPGHAGVGRTPVDRPTATLVCAKASYTVCRVLEIVVMRSPSCTWAGQLLVRLSGILGNPQRPRQILCHLQGETRGRQMRSAAVVWHTPFWGERSESEAGNKMGRLKGLGSCSLPLLGGSLWPSLPCQCAVCRTPGGAAPHPLGTHRPDPEEVLQRQGHAAEDHDDIAPDRPSPPTTRARALWRRSPTEPPRAAHERS